jgi:hypothetical protein
MPGLKMMMIDTDVSWLEKIGIIILLPILLVFGFGVLLWWLVLQYWKAVGVGIGVFRESLLSGRRSGIDRRAFLYAVHLPEKRSDKNRRERLGRRSGVERRSDKRSEGNRRQYFTA